MAGDAYIIKTSDDELIGKKVRGIGRGKIVAVIGGMDEDQFYPIAVIFETPDAIEI